MKKIFMLLICFVLLFGLLSQIPDDAGMANNDKGGVIGNHDVVFPVQTGTHEYDFNTMYDFKNYAGCENCDIGGVVNLYDYASINISDYNLRIQTNNCAVCGSVLTLAMDYKSKHIYINGRCILNDCGYLCTHKNVITELDGTEKCDACKTVFYVPPDILYHLETHRCNSCDQLNHYDNNTWFLSDGEDVIGNTDVVYGYNCIFCFQDNYFPSITIQHFSINGEECLCVGCDFKCSHTANGFYSIIVDGYCSSCGAGCFHNWQYYDAQKHKCTNCGEIAVININ